MIILLLFIAKLFPIAFPPIVIEAIIAATTNPTISIFKLNVLDNIAVIVVPAAPEIIPHISPITSQQKLETLSELFLNFTAILAPFTFLEFIEWKTASSAVVTDTPIISNNIPSITNNNVIIIPSHSDKLGIVISETNDSEKEITNDNITIVIIHLISTVSYFIFSFFLVCSNKLLNSLFLLILKIIFISSL